MEAPERPAPRASEAAELRAKADLLRAALEHDGLAGIRLRGQDWFAWATGGGSNAVLMATDAGVAEVFVAADGIRVLTNAIEADRLRAEELPGELALVSFEWAATEDLEAHVREAVGSGRVASDLPADGEVSLPRALVAAKRRLLPVEIDRYRSVGRDAAEALSETMRQLTSDMTELEAAGIGARELFRRGLDPALVLVAGSRRLPIHRHPRPTSSPIGDRVQVVLCGRRAGLFANLTRSTWFRQPTAGEAQAIHDVALVEAAAFDASRPGATLGSAFDAVCAAYARLGHPGAERDHHQGGTTGYRSREVVARAGDSTALAAPLALAWNPSLPGAKIEDTVILSDAGLEVITVDPWWPTVEVEGRPRPALLVRG